MTELEKLRKAAQLIEKTTKCRFIDLDGIPFLVSDRSAYLSINMRKEYDNAPEFCHIHFDVNLQTMGNPMNSEGLVRLQQEITRTYSLLVELESQEYSLSKRELKEFAEFIAQKEQSEAVGEAPQLGDMEMS